MFRALNCIKNINYTKRSISVCRILFDQSYESEKKAKESKRKVKETVELIQLVDQNDKILGLKPKKESELLAKKLNLSLERVTDPKYGKSHPAYKMFSAADLLKVEKKTSNAKVLKKLPINSRISENDLALKIRVIRKWLAKNCEVHIAIARNNDASTLMKTVFAKIQEEFTNEARILQVRQTENAIKFVILPPKIPKNVPAKTDDNKEQPTTES